MALSDYQQQNYTYDKGWNVGDWINGTQGVVDGQRTTYGLAGGQDYNTWLNTPSDFYNGQKPIDILGQVSGGQVTDPMNQLDFRLPDPIAGSLIPQGNDLAGMMLGLAPLALMVGGAAGVGGLSNAGWGEAAAAGAEGLGGFAPEAAFEGYGGTSVSGGLGGGYVPGVGDAAWGVNQAGFSPDAGFEQGVLPDSGGTSLSDLSRVPTGGGAGSGNPDPGFEGYGGTPANVAGGGGSTVDSVLDWIRRNPTAANLGGNLLTSGIGALGSYAASNAQQRSAADSMAMLERMYNQNRADLEPWRTAGVGALGNLTKLTTPGEQFDQAMLDPGYQFRLGEGSRAIDRAASARGRYYAPATMQALDRYNQNFATNEFGNVFNRNATLAGLGQVGTTAGVTAGQNYANNASNITQNAGDARASGYMGIANAVGGGIGQGVNYLNQQALLDALLRGRA